jgi:hypothetical protein
MFPQYNSDGTQNTSPSTAHTYFRPGRDYTIGTTVVDTASNLVAALTNSTDNLFSYFFTFTASNGVITVTEKYPSGLTPYDMFECSFITAGTATVSSIPTFNNITYPSDLEFPIGICTVYSGHIFSGIGSSYIQKSIKGGSTYYADKNVEVINNKVIKPNNLNKLGHSIKDFGAIGDGITDDTNAFLEALNYGGTIYIPDGTYIVNPPINTNSNDNALDIYNTTSVTLIGDRDRSKILIDGYFNFYTNYLKISGLTIQNKSALNLIKTMYYDTVIRIEYSQNNNTFIIEDCIISGYMKLNASNYTIKNILGINSSIFLNHGTNINIDNLIMYKCQSFTNYNNDAGAIKIQPTTNEPNDIAKITINNVYTYYYYYGLEIEGGIGNGAGNATDISITNCHCCNCDSTPFKMIGYNLTMNNCTGCMGGNFPTIGNNFGDIQTTNATITDCRDLVFEGMKIPVDGYLPTCSLGITSSKVIMNNCNWLYGITNNGSTLSGINYDNNINAAIFTIDNVKTAYLSAVPTAGTWSIGDTVYNTSTASGSPIGWKCTVAGTPGTWISFSQTSVASSISTVPNFIGQIAIVSGVAYIATNTSATTDWKQITNV